MCAAVIHRVEALGFRSLRDLSLALGPFHVLVGPNESGKTSSFDVLAFLGRLVAAGLDAAVEERTERFRDLLWRGQGDRLELAVEAVIPEAKKRLLPEPHFDLVRYEVAIGVREKAERAAMAAERVLLKTRETPEPGEREFFPFDTPARKTLLTPKASGVRTVLNKSHGGKDNYYSEVYKEPGKGWLVAFRLGPHRSALGNLPEDESKFPVTKWLKTLLAEGIRKYHPHTERLRRPSAPGQPAALRMDGSNLPWVVDRLQASSPQAYITWMERLRQALPDLESVRSVERPEDKHRYLAIRYRGGLDVPSWGASGGTLRLIALSLPAVLPELSGVYLLEAPEQGLHPSAATALFQSLSKVPHAQILMTTYSPVILSAAEPGQVICFAKTAGGATDVIPGDEHPALRKWRGHVDLGALFVDGVLGA